MKKKIKLTGIPMIEYFLTCDGMFTGQLGSSATVTQAKMSSFLKQKSTPMTKERYTFLNRSLVQMCAVDVRPLSLSEGVGFRYLLNTNRYTCV